MLDQVLDVFEVRPDADLDVMRPNQTLAELTARLIESLDRYLACETPDLVLVQGDTTTVFCGAWTAFYRHIPVGHVEAGLRTGNLDAPWPEEANRVLTSRLARLHFAPTQSARNNLLREGVPPDRVFTTGNTVIDALKHAVRTVRCNPPVVPGLSDRLQPAALNEPGASRLVLITGHRRESFGGGFEAICRAIAGLARRFPDVSFVYPVHLNPNVREPVYRLLRPRPGAGGSLGLENVHLIEPLDYLPFVALMDAATLVLTDSGGIQEEAPSLGKPVLVMRDTTERPEALESGCVKLVGTNEDRIVRGVSTLLETPAAAECPKADADGIRPSPYGDGQAAGRIVDLCRAFLEGGTACG
jgi:UDP-N-acetylglucosamine 2-epimerase (non-hydrolysing)